MSTAVGLRSQRGPILLAIMVSTSVIALDSTVVATAITSITRDIGGYAAYPWLFSVFLLTQAVTVPVYGKLADTFGRKRVILFGLALFLVASVLCGIAWSMPVLIASRALQGLAAGAILPVTTTIVGDIYSLEERARVQGYTSSVWGASAIIGPTLGGVFSELNLWRGIFLVNIPLCLLAMWLLGRSYHERLQPQRHRIDVLGSALLTSGLALVLLGVLEGGVAWDWGSVTSKAVFAGGAVLLAAFVLAERRAAEPVLPLWVFTRSGVAVALVLGLGTGGISTGFTAFVPEYLQVVTGVSPLWAGLSLAMMSIGWPIASSVAGRLYLRYGFRRVIVLGGILAVTGSVLMRLLVREPHAWLVALVLVVVGLGLGFTSVTSVVAAQTSVRWSERGVATGSSMMGRALGAAVVTAVLGAIANNVIASHGGDENDRATMLAASGAVFLGLVVVAVAMLCVTAFAPRSVDAPSEDDVSSG